MPADGWQPPTPALYHSTSPTLIVDGEAPPVDVLSRVLVALPVLLELNSPWDWMGPVAADAAEVAASRYAPLCAALHACGWPQLEGPLRALDAELETDVRRKGK